jgi:hypothetical protein
MRFYTKPHPCDCGIDRHARTLDVCVLNQDGVILLQRAMKAASGPVLKAMAADREDGGGWRRRPLHLEAGWPPSAPTRACPVAWALRAPCRQSREARPKPLGLMRTTARSCGGAGCSPRRLALPPGGGPRATSSGAACLWPANGPRGSPLANRRTASRTGPRAARSWPTRRTGMTWPHAFRRRPSSSASPGPAPASTLMTASAARRRLHVIPPSSAYRVRGAPRQHIARSHGVRSMELSTGEPTPPGGVPGRGGQKRPCCLEPTVRLRALRVCTRPSATGSAIRGMSFPWSSLPQEACRSASTIPSASASLARQPVRRAHLERGLAPPSMTACPAYTLAVTGRSEQRKPRSGALRGSAVPTRSIQTADGTVDRTSMQISAT